MVKTRVKELRALALAVVLITGIILASGCIGQEDQREGSREPAATKETQPEKLLTAREAYDLAVERAREEYGSVYFYQLTAGGGTVGLTTLRQKVGDDGRAPSWDVDFKSFHPDNGTYLQVFVAVENGEVTRVSPGKPLEMYFDLDRYLRTDVIDMEGVKVSGADAVRIADENGGSEFTRIMLRLVKSSAGYPYWIVAFGPGTLEKGEQLGLFVRINAETGEVVGKETKTYHIL